MIIALLLSLVPLIASASFCDDFFFGWVWLLISPLVIAALVRALVPMARLARAD